MTPERRLEIARRVLDAYAMWGPGSPVGGEWAYWRKEVRAPLYEALESGDADALARVLLDVLGRTEWNGLVTFAADSARDLDTRNRIVNDDQYPHDGYGNVYCDSARHDTEAHLLLELGLRHIVEIGGGYGDMAWRLYCRCRGVRYVNIDLADTLYLAYGFLAPRVDGANLSLGYNPDAAISLVPESDMPAAFQHGPPDAVVNYHSWGEMSREDVARQFAMIEQWKPKWVIHENASRPAANTTGISHTYRELLVNEYPALPGYRSVEIEPSLWSGSGGRYVRQVLRREAETE